MLRVEDIGPWVLGCGLIEFSGLKITLSHDFEKLIIIQTTILWVDLAGDGDDITFVKGKMISDKVPVATYAMSVITVVVANTWTQLHDSDEHAPADMR